jgi:DNA-binding NtrC family response regulator
MTRASGARVLIIDDERSILDTVRILLRGEGFDVVTAEPAARGASRIVAETRAGHRADGHPDAGHDRARGAGGDARVRPEVPVILMTAQASLQSAVQAVNEGAFYYLQKPFSNADLVALCRRAAETRCCRARTRR